MSDPKYSLPRDGAPRVGIVMMSALGDAVHVLPVINAIKRWSPGSRITWVLQHGPASLMRGHPAVDDIVLFDRRGGVRSYLQVRRALAARPFDVVLALQVYIKAGLVTALTRSPVKLGFDRARARDLNPLFTTHRIPPHTPQHVQDQYFEFLQALGVPHDPVRWELGPWEGERESQRQFYERLERPAAVLVIGSSVGPREWLPDRWAAVSDALYQDFGLHPVLAGGRSERELHTEGEIMRLGRAPVVSTLGVPLRELVGIIDGAALMISLDTAPLHMAVALDRPVISLIGHTNPKRTGPYRRFHDLLIDAYGDPGEDYPISTERRYGRMERIAARDVLDRVELWRERYEGRQPAASTRR
ncbi:MAG: glycosyltransferase family 9 protein [Gemmatimonadaceae bacterium]